MAPSTSSPGQKQIMRTAFLLYLLSAAMSAQAAESWLLQLDRWGYPSYMTVHLQDATTAGMTQWLQQDYGLSLSESAVVLGSAVQYSVANLAGRSVGMAAKLDKTLLPRR